MKDKNRKAMFAKNTWMNVRKSSPIKASHGSSVENPHSIALQSGRIEDSDLPYDNSKGVEYVKNNYNSIMENRKRRGNAVVVIKGKKGIRDKIHVGGDY